MEHRSREMPTNEVFTVTRRKEPKRNEIISSIRQRIIKDKIRNNNGRLTMPREMKKEILNEMLVGFKETFR